MRKKVFISMASFSLSIFLITTSLAVAGSKEIKARIMARLPVINTLKANGIIGENNRGYLEFLKPNKSNENVVNSENQDREKVYSAIARQQQVTVDLVGKRRAKQIAERANPGHWIQNDSGNWYQKK